MVFWYSSRISLTPPIVSPATMQLPSLHIGVETHSSLLSYTYLNTAAVGPTGLRTWWLRLTNVSCVDTIKASACRHGVVVRLAESHPRDRRPNYYGVSEHVDLPIYH